MRCLRFAMFATWAVLAVDAGADAGSIDDARLLAAATNRADWLTYARDYSNQRFSPLAQIDATNVKRLTPR